MPLIALSLSLVCVAIIASFTVLRVTSKRHLLVLRKLVFQEKRDDHITAFLPAFIHGFLNPPETSSEIERDIYRLFSDLEIEQLKTIISHLKPHQREIVVRVGLAMKKKYDSAKQPAQRDEPSQPDSPS